MSYSSIQEMKENPFCAAAMNARLLDKNNNQTFFGCKRLSLEEYLVKFLKQPEKNVVYHLLETKGFKPKDLYTLYHVDMEFNKRFLADMVVNEKGSLVFVYSDLIFI